MPGGSSQVPSDHPPNPKPNQQKKSRLPPLPPWRLFATAARFVQSGVHLYYTGGVRIQFDGEAQPTLCTVIKNQAGPGCPFHPDFVSLTDGPLLEGNTIPEGKSQRGGPLQDSSNFKGLRLNCSRNSQTACHSFGGTTFQKKIVKNGLLGVFLCAISHYKTDPKMNHMSHPHDFVCES